MPNSTIDRRLDRLNALETRAIAGRDTEESARWEQAHEVAQLIDAGLTQREIAAGWINGDTDRPYSVKHVNHVAQVWRRFHKETNRPRWTDAMATIWAGSDEVKTTTEVQREFHEARAPKSQETAEKLVENLIKGPAAIREQVAFGLRYHDVHNARPPRRHERAEREADVEENVIKPLKRGLQPMALRRLVDDLEDAREVLAELIADEVLDRGAMEQIEEANSRWVAELEVARASTEEGVS